MERLAFAQAAQGRGDSERSSGVQDLRTPMLPGEDGVLRRGIPISGYDHFGDPDVHDGKLFIPLEGKFGVSSADAPALLEFALAQLAIVRHITSRDAAVSPYLLLGVNLGVWALDEEAGPLDPAASAPRSEIAAISVCAARVGSTALSRFRLYPAIPHKAKFHSNNRLS